MKRTLGYLFSVLFTVFLVVSVMGCSSRDYDVNDIELPKAADDEAVLVQWDEHEILDNLPRYYGSGIFNSIAVTDGGVTYVYYDGVDEESFVDYTSRLKEAGYKLKAGSNVWVTEGSVGAPTYLKGDKQISVVWMYSGQLSIGVSYIED